jgi:hypothetical protein
MSRVSKFISVAAIAFAAVACGGSKENAAEKANIDGVLAGAPSSEVVLSVLELDQISVLDTLMTDEAGKFSYEVEVSEGDPEFVYVYADGRKIASLIVEAGDKVSFTIAEDGEVIFEKEVLYEQETLTEECPLLVKMTFFGTIPSYGIAYTDSDGEEKQFSVEMSGVDGSLFLAEM